jgi:hypothetical protein
MRGPGFLAHLPQGDPELLPILRVAKHQFPSIPADRDACLPVSGDAEALKSTLARKGNRGMIFL